MNGAMQNLIKSFVHKMVDADDEEKQMDYLNVSVNLITNVLGVFVAERISECDCVNCRKGAHEFLEHITDAITNGTNMTINANLEDQGKAPLYEHDPAFNPDVNRATYEEIMKELGNGN